MRQQGFTIIEIIVTIVVTTLFLVTFFQSFLLIESQRVAVTQQARANDLARSNLSKVSTKTALTSQTCTAATVTNGWDLAALGYTLEAAPGFTANLQAYPTNGCTNFANNPIRIVSTVSYKASGTNTVTKVVHAGYVQ